jgi:hypothetical protein
MGWFTTYGVEWSVRKGLGDRLGTRGYSRGTHGVLSAYSRGTHGVEWSARKGLGDQKGTRGYSRGTQRVLTGGNRVLTQPENRSAYPKGHRKTRVRIIGTDRGKLPKEEKGAENPSHERFSSNIKDGRVADIYIYYMPCAAQPAAAAALAARLHRRRRAQLGAPRHGVHAGTL